jgi:multidrug efflux system membrane fusion protein
MKATFENKDNLLWPGLSVATRLLVDTLKQVVIVPEDAVLRGPNGLYTFIVGDDNKAAIVPIQVAQEGDGQAVVSHGLLAGQRVVVAGQYRLQDGTEVRANDASAPAKAEQAAQNTSNKAP